MLYAVSGAQCIGAIFLTAAALAPTGASALDLKPALKLELAYDDNVGETEHGTGDFLWIIAPSVGVARPGRVTTWQAWARRNVRLYSRLTSFSTTSDAVSARVAYTPSVQTSASADFKFWESGDVFDPDQGSVLFPSIHRTGVGTAHLTLTGLETSGQIEAWDYSRVDLSDATTRRFALTLLPTRSRTTAGLISFRVMEMDFNGNQGLGSNVARLGFRRRHTTAIASQLELGGALVDYHDGTSKAARPAIAARVVLYGRGPGEPVIAEASLERDATTTLTAMLRKRLPIGTATASWETGLEAEGGYYAHPVTARRLSFALVDTLGSRTTISMEGSFGSTLPFHAPGLRADNFRAAATLSAPLLSWVTGQAGYLFVEQTDPNRPIPLNYRRSRIFVSLTAGF